MQSGDIEMKELLQQALDALITSLAYVDATSAIAEVQGALKAIEQAIAQEQETKPLLPNCFNCKHSETPCNSATCRDCKHAYSSIDNWEPKP